MFHEHQNITIIMSPTVHVGHISAAYFLAWLLILPWWLWGSWGRTVKGGTAKGHRANRELGSNAGFDVCCFIPASCVYQEFCDCSETVMTTRWTIRWPELLSLRRLPVTLCLHSFPSPHKHERGPMTDSKPSVRGSTELCLATQLCHSTTQETRVLVWKWWHKNQAGNALIWATKTLSRKSGFSIVLYSSGKSCEMLGTILTHDEPNTISAAALLATWKHALPTKTKACKNVIESGIK